MHAKAGQGVQQLFEAERPGPFVTPWRRVQAVETASNTPMFLTLLPFLGSGFVPTDSMPTGLRQFAEYQPLTPVTETVRRLLTGGAAGHSAIAAIAWSVGITIAAYLWSIRLYNRRPIR